MSDIGFYKFLKGILSAVKETYMCEAQIKRAQLKRQDLYPKIIEENIYRGNHLTIIRVDDAKGKRGELIQLTICHFDRYLVNSLIDKTI